MPDFDLDAVLGAASAAIGTTVRDARELRVRGDAGVWRVEVDGVDGVRSAVVKLHGAGEGSVREQALLELAAEHDLPGVVGVLGIGDPMPVVVTRDLGDGPSLADALLGDDQDHATAAVLAWVDAVSGLQVASRGLRAPFAARLAELSPWGEVAPDSTIGALRDAADGELAATLALLDVDLPASAAAELHAIADALDVSSSDVAVPAGLVPGDTCPDNTALDADGAMTLFDLEAAEFRHAAWEAAYLLVPFPTCWCCWHLPPALQRAAIDRWTSRLAAGMPDFDEARFAGDVVRATAAWSAIWAGKLLPRAADGDDAPVNPRSPSPGRQTIVQQRLATLAASLDVAPALAAVGREALQASRARWGERPLALAPAFR